MSSTPLSDQALETLFFSARSHNGWLDRPVTDEQLRQIYARMIMGPTSANCLPARILFLRSDEAKQRLKPSLSAGNVDKSMTAPVVAVIGMDLEFHEHLPKLFPHTDARSWYAGKPEKIKEAAFRNSSLQGAYFIMAVRSLGLDAGPMSGFDAEKLNQEFFPDGRIKVNFICGVGHGDPEKLFPRLPRLEFEQACQLL